MSKRDCLLFKVAIYPDEDRDLYASLCGLDRGWGARRIRALCRAGLAAERGMLPTPPAERPTPIGKSRPAAPQVDDLPDPRDFKFTKDF